MKLDPTTSKVEIMAYGLEKAYCKCWLTDVVAQGLKEVFDMEIDMLKGQSRKWDDHHTLYKFVLTDPKKIMVMEKFVGHVNIANDLQERLN